MPRSSFTCPAATGCVYPLAASLPTRCPAGWEPSCRCRHRPETPTLVHPPLDERWSFADGHLRPQARSCHGGPFREIATAVPSIKISEHLPRLARQMDRLVLVRP